MIADEIKNRISELNKELDTLYKKEAEEPLGLGKTATEPY